MRKLQKRVGLDPKKQKGVDRCDTLQKGVDRCDTDTIVNMEFNKPTPSCNFLLN